MSAARGRAAARVSAAVGVVVALYFLVPAPILGGDAPFRAPSSARWLGTDGQGQDVLSLLVHGAPRTLGVGLLSGLGMVVFGAAVALLAAWAPRAAFALNGLTTAMLALPGLPLMVLLAAWLPPGPATMVVVLVLTGWPWHARVLAAPARVATTHGWVEAARLAGEPPWRLMIVEVLPSLGPILLAGWLGASAYALGAEVGLEYVGLAALDVNTWGTVLYWAANDAALLVGAWWVFLPVGVAIGATGLGLLSVSRRLERWFDPRLDAVERARRLAFSPSPAAVEPDAPGVVLDIRSLRVGFTDREVAGGWRVVVHDASLTLLQRESVGLTGPSGSGKSAWIAAALGLLAAPGRALGGSVQVGGWRVPGGAPMPDGLAGAVFGWVPQAAQAALHPARTVRQVLTETLVAHRRAVTAACLLDALADVQLDADVLDKLPGALSGGMRQRVVLAAALILRPRVLVLDEPSTALDPEVAEQILSRLGELRRQRGFCVLLISHDAGLVARHCDRQLRMEGGRLVGPVEEPAREAGCANLSLGPVRARLSDVSGPTGAPRVRDVSLTLRAGEVTLIVGPSGGGKTTLARLLVGLEPVDAGERLVAGAAALVHQDPYSALHPYLASSHGVRRALRLAGADPARWAELFDDLELPRALGARPPSGLSGGQRQRVAVARALAGAPSLIVADEPTAMLDAAVRAAALSALVQAARARQIALVIVTHDLEAAMPWADQLVVVDGGRVVEQGPAAAVCAAPAHEVTARLLRAMRGQREVS